MKKKLEKVKEFQAESMSKLFEDEKLREDVIKTAGIKSNQDMRKEVKADPWEAELEIIWNKDRIRSAYIDEIKNLFRQVISQAVQEREEELREKIDGLSVIPTAGGDCLFKDEILNLLKK